MIDDALLEKILAENPAVNPTDYSTGLTDISGRPTLDDLMVGSYRTTPIVRPPAVPPAQQRVDPETMRRVFPAAFQRASSESEIPRDVDIRSKIASSTAAWDNFFRNVGRRGRANPMYTDPEAARSSVINDYINRRNAEEANRQNQRRIALEERKQELAERPKPVDPIEQAQKLANLRKTGLETIAKERELEKANKEDEYKTELVRLINTSGKVAENAASMAMSLNTLESMASDIGLDPLKVKRAFAGAGVRSSGTVYRKNIPASYDMAGHPEAFENTADEVEFYGQFVHSDLKENTQAKLRDPNVSPKDKQEALKRFMDLGVDQYKKEKADASKFVDQLQKLKGTELPTFMASLEDVRGAMKKANTSDWNKWRSSIRVTSEGTLVADALTSSDDPAARELWRAISRLEEAYGRGQSGAAIAEEEWRNFRRQLGSGAFSTLPDLYRGVASMIASVRNKINTAWNTLHPAIRQEYEEQGRVEGWLPKKASSKQIKSFAKE